MKQLTRKQMKEYDKFTAEQFRIIQNHFGRCMSRIYNKYWELQLENEK